MNKIIIIGRMTKDAEERRTSGGVAFVQFGLAVLRGRERGKASGLYKLYSVARVGGEYSEIRAERGQAGDSGRITDTKLHGQRRE